MSSYLTHSSHDHIFFRHFRHRHGEGYIQLSPFSGGIDYEVSISGISRISNIRLKHKHGKREIAVVTPVRRFSSDSFYDIGTIGPDLIESPYSIYDLLSILMGRLGYIIIQTDDGEVLVNADLDDYFPDDFIVRIKPVVCIIRHSCHVEDEDDDFDRKHHCETHERIHQEFVREHIDIKQVNITNVTQVVQHVTNIVKAPPPVVTTTTTTASSPPATTKSTGTGTGTGTTDTGTTTTTGKITGDKKGRPVLPSTSISSPSPSSSSLPPTPVPAPTIQGQPLIHPDTLPDKAAKSTDKPILDSLTTTGNKHKDVLGPDNKSKKPLSASTPKINCKKNPTDPTCGAAQSPKSTAGETPHIPLTNDSNSPTTTAALAIIDNHPTAVFFVVGVVLFASILYFFKGHKGFKLNFNFFNKKRRKKR